MGKRLKGNLLIGQSGGPTRVINQSVVGIVLEATKYEEIDGIYGARHGVKGILKEEFFDLKRESLSDLELVARTPGAGLGSVRKKPTEEECAQMFEIFKAHSIRYFFYIGGNDSAESAFIINELAKKEEYELRVFHVPKTIDNDLRITDHCPGYGSAAKFVALAHMGDDMDNRSLAGIKINIVMGRNAGFLTAASILAREREDDSPHLIYVPEVNFNAEKFLADVDRFYTKYGRCVAAVSEGIHDSEGKLLIESKEMDSHENIQLSGTGALGDLLAGLVKKGLGAKIRVRADTLGYLQRSFPGVVSEVDAAEARLVGEAAVRWAVAENVDGSVALRRTGNGADYGVEPLLVDLKDVAKNTKSLDPSYIFPGGNDIDPSFIAYVKPLVGEMPVMGHLRGYMVPKKLNK